MADGNTLSLRLLKLHSKYSFGHKTGEEIRKPALLITNERYDGGKKEVEKRTFEREGCGNINQGIGNETATKNSTTFKISNYYQRTCANAVLHQRGRPLLIPSPLASRFRRIPPTSAPPPNERPRVRHCYTVKNTRRTE